MGYWVALRRLGFSLSFEKLFQTSEDARTYCQENNLDLDIQYHPIQGIKSENSTKGIFVSEAHERATDFMEFVGLYFTFEEATAAYRRRSERGSAIEVSTPEKSRK